MSTQKNEQKSPEYVPPGPGRVGRLHRVGGAAAVLPEPTTAKPVDADMERMKAAHAARMAEPAKGETAPDPEAKVLLPAPEAIFNVAQTGRVSSASPNLSAGSPPIQHAAFAALVEELTLTSDNVRGLIVQETRALEEMLLSKNARYGNSALEPLGIFSKLPAVQGILVRLDDKLKRIKNMGLDTADEDTVEDLIGYLVLLRVARRLGLDK